MTPLVALALLGFTPYWRDPRIHNLGNVGFPGGFLHALLAPVATRIIDEAAYGGRNVRAELLARHTAADEAVVDLCCGVGFSTKQVGVDTSPQMLEMARRLSPCAFHEGNAETWGDTNGCDVVTLMFALHEMPADARGRVLANARRVARDRVVVVDIAPHYRPSPTMLAGEPFVLDYLARACDELGAPTEVVAKTVAVWVVDAAA